MDDVVAKSYTGVLPSRTFRKKSEIASSSPRQYCLIHSYLALRLPWEQVVAKVSLAKIIGINITNCSGMSVTTPQNDWEDSLAPVGDHSAGFATRDDNP